MKKRREKEEEKEKRDKPSFHLVAGFATGSRCS
jgi:hypothetical protein